MAFDSGQGVQYIAELGFGLESAMQDLDKLEKLVREKSITIGQLAKVDFKIDGLFEQFNQPVPRLFSEIAKEATLMEEKIGMSVAAARKQMQGMGHIGDDIIEYFKKDGKKAAVEWTDAFEQEFRGTDFRRLMSPYIKWTEDGSGINPDDLTNELSDKFPQLSKDVYNYTELWERLAEQVRDFRAQAKQLAETGANNYFEQLQMTAQGTGDVFDRLIHQQESLHRAGGFTEGIGKGLMSAEDIQQMATHLQEVANIQTKISFTADKSGETAKINIAYTGELNEKWQETYKWVSQVDNETGAITEGFKRVSSVATESADAAKKLSDEFNRIQLATEKMNLSSIQIFEQGGDMPSADRLRAINAQMGEIKQNADSITRSDIERAKLLQRHSELISVAAKEEKLRQQAAAASSKEQRQAAEAERKEIAQISAQYSKVAAIQKDIRKYSLDTSGYNAQLSIVKEQSDALFEKLRTNQQITDEERKQLETNQQLLSQIQAQVSAQKSEKPDILSSDKSGGLLAQSGKWFGAYQIWHEMKRGATETVDTMREVETVMMEIGRVMELNAEQSNRLRDSLFGVSSEMAQTFKDTADISKRFAQAGYQEAAENIEMTRTALLAMNTAELDAVNSTDSMVGILKQWNLEGKDLITVIDKLNYAADNNAVTTQDLVDAMLRSSSAAKNMKMSFDETVGTLVALKEASGRTGREIGTALNSIIAFTTRNKSLETFESMGVKVWLDEQKTSLNSVMEIWRQLSALYATEGEKVVNTLAKQTDMTELFSEEVAAATNTIDEYNQMLDTQTKLQGELNDAERKTLTEQFGVYRRNYVIALLENFEKIGKVVGDMDNAIGHSARENARYMETFDAKIKQLVTSLQELAVQAGEAGLLDVAKVLTDAATAAATLSKNTGGIIPLITLLAIAYTRLKKEATQAAVAATATNAATGAAAANAAKINVLTQAMNTLKRASDSAGGGIKGMAAGAHALLGTLGLITLGVQAVIGIYSAWNAAQEKARQAAIDATDSYRQESDALSNYADKITDLKTQLDAGNLSHEQEVSIKKELLTIQKDLIEKYSLEAQGIDLVNDSSGAYLETLKAISREKAWESLREGAKGYEQAVKEMTKVSSIPYTLGMSVTPYALGEELGNELLDIVKSFESRGIKRNEQNGEFEFAIQINANAEDAERTIKDFAQAIEVFQSKHNLKDDSTLNNILGYTYDSYNQAKSILDNYASLYSEFIRNTILANKKIVGSADYYDKAIQAAEKYNDAILKGDEKLIKSTQTVFDNLRQEIESAYSESTPEYLRIFNEIFDSVSDGMARFKDTLNADSELRNLADSIKNIGLSADDLDLAKLGGDNAEIFELLAQKADEYGYSVENLINWLIQLGYIQGVEIPDAIDNQTYSLDELNAAIDNIQSSYNTLASAIEEYNNTGSMSVDMLQAFLNLSPEYLAALDLENGKIVINTQRIQELTDALKQEAITKLQNAAAADIKALADGRVEEMSNLAKTAVASLGNSAETAGAQMSAAASGAFDLAAGVAAIMAAEGVDTSKIKAETDAIVGAYQNAANNINNIKIDFGGIGGGGSSGRGGSGGGGNSAATKAETEALKAKQDAINDEIKLLQEREKTLQEYHKNEIDRLKEQQKKTQESFKKQEESVKKRYDAEIKELRDLKAEYSNQDDRADYEKRRAELLRERADEEKKTGREAVERIKEIDKELADLDEKERRRKRDVSIDADIADIEEKRDRKVKAIQSEAEAEQAKYDEQIQSIEELIKLEKLYFEEQINNFKEILGLLETGQKSEAYKKAYDAQKKELDGLKGKTDSDTRTMTTYIEQMYTRATKNSANYAKSAISDAEKIIAAYQRILDKMDEAEERAKEVKETTPSSSSSSSSKSSSSLPSPKSSISSTTIKSSHTGSLVLSEGLVNVAPGEIIVRPDISAGLLKTIDLIEKMSTQTNYNNVSNSYSNPTNSGNVYNIKVILDGAIFQSETAAKTLSYDLNRELTQLLGQNAFGGR